jgi:RNA recognition motif-containing protein
LQTWRWQDNKRQRVKGKEAAPSLGRPGVIKDEKKTVYVKNLPFTATEEDIEAFFAKAGKVVDVRRGTNSEGELCFTCMLIIHLDQP